MRWPWSKRTEAKTMPRTDTHEGENARIDATANLASAAAQWPEVRRVAQSLRELRERNHFRQQIENIFDGGENRER